MSTTDHIDLRGLAASPAAPRGGQILTAFPASKATPFTWVCLYVCFAVGELGTAKCAKQIQLEGIFGSGVQVDMPTCNAPRGQVSFIYCKGMEASRLTHVQFAAGGVL